MDVTFRPSHVTQKWKKCQLYFLLFCFFSQTNLVKTNEDVCPPHVIKFENDELCLTRDCAVAAAKMIENMDFSVNPCQDFYKFACGSFMKKNLLPEHEKRLRTFDLYEKAFDLQLKDVMETLNPHGQPEVVKRVQEAYHVCINTEEFSRKEMAAVRTFVKEVLQWPLAEGRDWKPRFNNLSDFLINLETVGYPNYLFTISLSDITYNDIKAVKIKPHVLATLRPNKTSSYEQEKVNHLYRVAMALGNSDTQSIEEDIKAMGEVTQFIDEYLKDWHKRNKDEIFIFAESISISKLTEKTEGKIDWLSVIKGKTKNWNMQFTEHNYVNVPMYHEMELIIEITKRFPFRVLYNIIGWNTISEHLLKIGGPTLEEIYTDYEKTRFRGEELKPLPRGWKHCIDELLTVYPMAVARMFLERYFKKDDKEKVTEMVRTIIKTTEDVLNNNKWIFESETSRLKEFNLDYLGTFIAYPDYLFNDTALDLEYAHLPEIPDTYFLYKLHLERAFSEMKFTQVETNNEIWKIYPLRINAIYDAYPSPAIWLPAAILKEPHYESNRLAALNFGSIGVTIGHEIAHAIDSSLLSDKYLRNHHCLINQFNKFCPEELQGDPKERYCVHGRNTRLENIADQAGLTLSFAAYKKWIQQHGKEKRLAGLQEFSPEQLFFLSFAHQWCELIPPANWWAQYEDDRHAPAKYRVLGTLSNSKEFREAFSCPEGPMNRGNQSCSLLET